MADKLQLEIITPDRTVLEVEAAWVTVPGSEGELGILPEHVPLVTTMDTGILEYATAGGGEARVAVHYGYAQVRDDRVSVLSDMAEAAEDIDLERARQAEKRAREKLAELIAKQNSEEHEMRKFEAKLRRAITRQRMGG